MSLTRAAEAFANALLGDDPVALYESAPCGYLSTTPDGVVVKANATFLTWTGYRAEDVVGRHLTDFLSPGARVYHETHYAPMLRLQGFVRELAVDMLRRDGSRLPVLLNATLGRDAHGEPRVIRLAVFDATERRRYEQELLRAMESAREAQGVAEDAESRAQGLVDLLQRTLVPGELPRVAGLDLHGAFRPAGRGAQVGGDFYDAWVTRPDECWLVMGDVSGKGVEAAVVTSLIRHSARALTLGRDRPEEILADLNRLLLEHETERYSTAIIARLRRTSAAGWDLAYGSGGHPPAAVIGPGGRATYLDPGGQVLGLLPDADFEVHHRELAVGETLLLYTDGVTEGRSESEFFGDQRLLSTAAGTSGAEDLVDTLMDAVLDFQGDIPRDDIACLAATVSG